MVYLTRVETFNAAHKLFNPNWTEEKNKAVFGKCANKNWHGHNYELHVTIKGEPKEETGYVFNAKTLSVFIKEVTKRGDVLISEKTSHKDLREIETICYFDENKKVQSFKHSFKITYGIYDM